MKKASVVDSLLAIWLFHQPIGINQYQKANNCWVVVKLCFAGTFAPGDIITCKVIFNVDDGGRGYNTAIRFRHNGMEMETGYFNSSGELYPFIKMGSEGTQVQFTVSFYW